MKFGLIGHPVAHSFSPRYFSSKFKALGLEHSYDALDINELSGLRSKIASLGWSGFNVTIPHKQAILGLLDEVDHDAEKIGAVNTVVVKDGKWKGFNTDHLGFGLALDEIRITGDQKALVLGNGGAAKAVIYALAQRGIDHQIVSRSGMLDYDKLHPNHLREHQIIINTTPLGMPPNEADMPDIPYEALTSQHLLFDLIYHPRETRFLARGRALGARTMNGERMLHLQADESWRIWQSHM